MLEHLRAMGVFACVVEKSSFSGAARHLGITTSAVSQQIRSLEIDMEVTLLHRSTRKLSLTEAGQVLYNSCKEMLLAAEKGKVSIHELRDDLIGDLRISMTRQIGAAHIVPALSSWITAHPQLNIIFEADNYCIDLIEQRIDLAIRLTTHLDFEKDVSQDFIKLVQLEQVLVATPEYLARKEIIREPQDLIGHELICLSYIDEACSLDLSHSTTKKMFKTQMKNRLETNDVYVAKSLCYQGLGIGRALYVDVREDLAAGRLIEVLPDFDLPKFNLYAILLKKDQQPLKVRRCLDILKQYFAESQQGASIYKKVS